MIIQQLRNTTKEAHLKLDHLFFPLVRQTKTVDAYIKILTVFYGFFKPVQDQIDNYLNDEKVDEYSQRRKPSSLLNDIAAFAYSVTPIAECSKIPVITNEAQALGAFYVLEGSSMGGAIITKKLKENLNLHTHQGFSFFEAYNGKSPAMWDGFVNSVNRYPFREGQQDDLFEAARDTYSKFGIWLTNNLVQ